MSSQRIIRLWKGRSTKLNKSIYEARGILIPRASCFFFSGGRRLERRPLCMFCVMFMAALIVLNAAGISLLPRSRDLRYVEKLLEDPVEAEIYGIVDSCELREGYGILTIRKSTFPFEGAYYYAGKVRVTYDGEERYPCGWTVAVSGKAGVIRGPENPGEFDNAQFCRVQNIFIEVKNADVRVIDRRTDLPAEALERASLAADSCILDAYPEDVSGVLCSMLTGTRTWLDDETRGYWQAGGVMHMLAISGLHIGILGMGLYGIIRKAGVPLVPSGIAVMSLMIIYTFFVGCSVSSVRACIMFALMVTASYTGRTYDPMTALAAAAVLILLKNPEYMFYGGFQLSVAAVVLSRIFHKRSIWMQALLLYLWMLPLVASVFFEIPLLTVPVNIIAVPLLPFTVGLGAAGCAGSMAFGCLSALAAHGGAPARAMSEGLRILGGACTFPAVMLVRGLNLLLREVSSLPCSVLVTGKPGFVRCCLYFALLLGWTRAYVKLRLSRTRFLLLIFIPVFTAVLAFRMPSGLDITFLSVGQGDGIVIKMYGDSAVITDCGSTSAYQVGKRRMDPFLRHEGIRDIPYIIATHMDEDHVSGIRELLEMKAEGQLHMSVGALVLPCTGEGACSSTELEELAAKAGVRVLRVQRGDELSIREVRIEIMGPDTKALAGSDDANEQSIVFALHYRDFDALMTGDVTGRGEEAVTEQLRERTGEKGISYEILKVAHHGSSSSTDEEFLELVRPEVSVISCGEGNRYGHPHRELLERLEEAGSRIFRTDRSGAVTVRTDGRRFEVREFK
ncbi:MAG: DNA internalization-related competence protein ComEC/Rec2 [Lachnospiraceae bacterium]|nr:DNA internalization-related competence protein ComEC/Rec2 [Lachnospiraceae bacterium]